MVARSYLWTMLLGDAAPKATLDQRLAAIRTGWDRGDLTGGDVQGLCFDAAVYDGISETLSKLDSPWRDRLFDELRHWAVADPTERPVRVFFGIYSYEVEPDPEKSARMRREVEAAQRAEDDHFMTVVRPIIDAWWTSVPKSD